MWHQFMESIIKVHFMYSETLISTQNKKSILRNTSTDTVNHSQVLGMISQFLNADKIIFQNLMGTKKCAK